MDALMAFVSIIAIIAIVVVAGGLIAFIGHMIIGAFDNEKREQTSSKEMLDYSQYKQLESAKETEESKEYNFEAINDAKAKEEQSTLESSVVDDEFAIDDKNEDIQEIESELKAINETKVDDDSEDDDDLDAILNEISEDVIEEEKERIQEESTVETTNSVLDNYNIDTYLNQKSEDSEESEDVEDSVEESTESEELAETEEVAEEINDDEASEESDDDFIDLFDDIDDETNEEVKDDEEEEVIVPVTEPVSNEAHEKEIEELKAQLAYLNKKLAEATSNKVEVVTVNATEEELENRLAILEERLKNVTKDYKINMKEFRPLKKVMNDYERYQAKLRKKDVMVAKKKVALYGVNNYVDIDKDRAEKLSNELELLEGLRLSVSHCEEVINANKDRYPILEHTNKILEDQIANIEADIASTKESLRKIREDNGSGDSESNGNE